MHTTFLDEFNALVQACYGQYLEEQDLERQLHTEGAIYGLYVKILHAEETIDTQHIIQAISSVDTIERICLMSNYCYESFHTRDYRFEFPCRTSAIIVDILEKTLGMQKQNRGSAWLVRRILKERSGFLSIGYSNYQEKVDQLLRYL